MTMGTGHDAKKQRVLADGLLEELLVKVRAKLGEPPAELINWLIQDGAAPEESTATADAPSSSQARLPAPHCLRSTRHCLRSTTR